MKKMDTKEKTRREFIKGAGLAGVAGGIAVATVTGKPARAEVADTKKSVGYRETEHIKTYYELAKF